MNDIQFYVKQLSYNIWEAYSQEGTKDYNKAQKIINVRIAFTGDNNIVSNRFINE